MVSSYGHSAPCEILKVDSLSLACFISIQVEKDLLLGERLIQNDCIIKFILWLSKILLYEEGATVEAAP